MGWPKIGLLYFRRNCGLFISLYVKWERCSVVLLMDKTPQVLVHWIIRSFFGRNDAKAETPVLWPPHEKSWLIGKDSDAERDWGQEEKGMTEDEMAGWCHWLDGRESEWTPGVGDGQGGLACCDSWGHKESDTTERLIWSDTNLGDLCKSFGCFKEKINRLAELFLYILLLIACSDKSQFWVE